MPHIARFALSPGIFQAVEHLLVQQLVPEAAIE